MVLGAGSCFLPSEWVLKSSAPSSRPGGTLEEGLFPFYLRESLSKVSQLPLGPLPSCSDFLGLISFLFDYDTHRQYLLASSLDLILRFVRNTYLFDSRGLAFEARNLQ